MREAAVVHISKAMVRSSLGSTLTRLPGLPRGMFRHNRIGAVSWLRASRRQVWFAWLAFAAISLPLLAYLSVTWHREQTGTAALHSAAFGLGAHWEGKGIRLTWNGANPAIQHADLGILRIVDGNLRRDDELDAGALRGGTVWYKPLTEEMKFRLDVLGPAEHAAEWLLLIAPHLPAPPSSALRAPAPPAPVAKAAPPPPTPQKKKNVTRKRAARRSHIIDGDEIDDSPDPTQ